jgi:RNA polymerase sigma-70 factor (ECF subfamily)
MTVPPSDHELASMLAAGEPRAFAALYERLHRPLFRVAITMLSDRSAAEDAVHDLFVSLTRYRDRFSVARDLDAYVFACLRNSIHVTVLRRQSDRRALVKLAMSRERESAAPAIEDDELAAAMAMLPDQQREVVTLKVDAGLTFAQIGNVLGISMNTAASRYRYAMEKLRGWLEERK